MRVFRINNDRMWETWNKLKKKFPTIRLSKRVYLLRRYTYEDKKISPWGIVIEGRRTG